MINITNKHVGVLLRAVKTQKQIKDLYRRADEKWRVANLNKTPGGLAERLEEEADRLSEQADKAESKMQDELRKLIVEFVTKSL